MRSGVAALALLLSAGCASDWVNVAPLPPPKYETLGAAEAEACGLRLLALPWHQVLSKGMRTRVRDAYDAAVAGVPGATALIDVTFQERWSYGIILSEHCVAIRGEAIR
jgi:hypothetical protein